MTDTCSTGAKREAMALPYLRTFPLEAMMAGAVALEYGTHKYSARNWEKGLPWQQMIDSLRRHLDDLELRQDIDDGPGGSMLPTVCLIMSSAAMLTTSVLRDIGDDNRLPAPDERVMGPKELAQWGRACLDAAARAREEAEETDLIIEAKND